MTAPLSLYTLTIPVLKHSLKALTAILDKAQAHAAEHKIDETVLTGARLFPNMFPLSRQVQIACDLSKGCGARLAGVDNPSFADIETTFDELKERIAATMEFLDSLDAESIDNAGAREIRFKAGPNELSFTGNAYITEWLYPNFYFHVATAYNILRHNGLAIGKLDYLGANPPA